MQIHVNTCTQEDIEWLPGIGPATAQKIIEARPVADERALEEIVPPSAWLKIQEAGVSFSFGAETEPGAPPEAPAPIFAPPPTPTIRMDSMTLRRVLSGEPLSPGAEYLCIWNMKFGPQGEASTPNDVPTQAEIEDKLGKLGVSIAYAHYAPSIQVRTVNRGLVPLVLFEIIPEETEDARRENEDVGPVGEGEG